MLVFLRLLWRAFGLFVVLVVLTGAVGVLFFFRTLFGVFVLVFVDLVGVIAQLIAVAQIRDHLACKSGKGRLILQNVAEVFQRIPCLFLNEPAPQFHRVVRTRRQVTPGGQMAHKVSRSGGQWHVAGLRRLIIALADRFVFDLDVDIGGGAGHVARADGLAPRGFHRLVQIARHVALRFVFRMGLAVVITPVKRQRICGATRQQHLVTCHATAHLRQAHVFARQASGIDGKADVQVRIIGHHLGGFGQRLFERICGVVGWLGHLVTIPIFLFANPVLCFVNFTKNFRAKFNEIAIKSLNNWKAFFNRRGLGLRKIQILLVPPLATTSPFSPL